MRPVFILSTCLVFLLSTASVPIELGYLPACNRVKPKGKFTYNIVHTEPVMKNLKMIGKVGDCGVEAESQTAKLHGRILRAMRFQNISSKVEEKYGLPKNMVLAMVIQETGGADMLPNCLDDGGIGICHMQGSTASEFGLKTYRNYKALRSKTHGRALRSLIRTNRYDRKKLIKYDDRFHPILNLDAAGRMLACYKSRKKRSGESNMQTAVRHYAGAYNYRHYWRNVSYFRKQLNNPEVSAALEKEFNKQNRNLTINGKKGDYKGYIKAHQEQNENYGLSNY